jgi:hypothetical protein
METQKNSSQKLRKTGSFVLLPAFSGFCGFQDAV